MYVNQVGVDGILFPQYWRATQKEQTGQVYWGQKLFNELISKQNTVGKWINYMYINYHSFQFFFKKRESPNL